VSAWRSIWAALLLVWSGVAFGAAPSQFVYQVTNQSFTNGGGFVVCLSQSTYGTCTSFGVAAAGTAYSASAWVTSTALTSALASYATTTSVNTALSSYATTASLSAYASQVDLDALAARVTALEEGTGPGGAMGLMPIEATNLIWIGLVVVVLVLGFMAGQQR